MQKSRHNKLNCMFGMQVSFLTLLKCASLLQWRKEPLLLRLCTNCHSVIPTTWPRSLMLVCFKQRGSGCNAYRQCMLHKHCPCVLHKVCSTTVWNTCQMQQFCTPVCIGCTSSTPTERVAIVCKIPQMASKQQCNTIAACTAIEHKTR